MNRFLSNKHTVTLVILFEAMYPKRRRLAMVIRGRVIFHHDDALPHIL